MRKISVKSSSKSKELPRPPLGQNLMNMVQTEIAVQSQRQATNNKSAHRRSTSKHKSELHPIQQFSIFKKSQYLKKESGHKRRVSKISHQSGRQSSQKLKTFGVNDNFDNAVQGLDAFDYRYFETGGVDRILTGRNKPQLPTNIGRDITSFKSTSVTVSVLEQQGRRRSKFNAPIKQSREWSESSTPLSPKQVIKNYSHYLTPDQKHEILGFSQIYYIGHKTSKKFMTGLAQYDNEDKEYTYTLNDHIGYRYQIIRLLGKGSYGQVFRVFDHKKKKEAALKIIKNKKKVSKQSLTEISILNNIKRLDPNGFSGIVKIKESLIFRKHQCIVFELLSDNLYQLIKDNNYTGLNVQLIKKFTIQLLNSLNFLWDQSIIHCDLKPQNILLVEPNKARIKIIDFGSSCLSSEIIYEYIQSRYYRAPEITLGIPYDQKIDMWSLGCILVQLYTGVPLFPGDSQEDQMAYTIQFLGMPEEKVLKKGNRRGVFFDEAGHLKKEIKAKIGREIEIGNLKDVIKDSLFLEFVEGLLRWDSGQRMTPKQALKHQWIVQGLPPEIKQLHSLFQEVKQSARIRKNSKRQRKQNPPSKPSCPRSIQKVTKPVTAVPQNHSLPSKQPKSKPLSGKKPLFGHRRDLSSQK